MSNNNDKINTFLNFLKEHSDSVSKDNLTAIKYLEEQGKKPEEFANSMLMKIRKAQLIASAKKNATVFEGLQKLKELAILKAKEIINTPGFSIIDFMSKEKFTLQNRNLENLSKDEIQNILEDYIFLKMQDPDSSKEND